MTTECETKSQDLDTMEMCEEICYGQETTDDRMREEVERLGQRES